ncbi:MAG: hypothetical protein GEV10_27995 [Streptosporangiales bacterium]|nr:hypothetical protein [Streptosporangiales bacterium]
MLLAGASVVVLAVCLVGLAVDGRALVGAPIWLKPAKFAVSIAIYCFTLAWLLSLLQRRRRLGRALGSIIAITLGGELVVIVVQVVRGEMSHFNISTPLNAVLWASMGVMIATLWVANLVAGALFLTQKLGERSTAWAIRAGTVIALAGMAVAFFMPQETAAQDAAREAGRGSGIVGAHTVGVPDGGPGLPITGWSTVAGDLRVPHFVGIHGLQVLILLALVLLLLARRYPRFASDTLRLRVVLVAAGAYAGVLALVTWQAFRGQSVVRPDALTASVAAALAVAAVVGLLLALRTPREPTLRQPEGATATVTEDREGVA